MKDEEIIEIDLTKGNQLNEFYNAVVMGEKIKQMLWLMFGSNSTLNPFSGVIKGSPQQRLQPRKGTWMPSTIMDSTTLARLKAE